MIEVQSLAIPDVKLITPKKFGDHRGFFSEVFNRDRLKAAGIELDFCQDNQSLSAEQGTLRGLHFQTPPFAQSKLVRVVRGSIWDVAVDIRKGSPSFGKWVAAVISAENWTQILVPRGFAHGFVTLEPMTEVLYKVDNAYSKDHDHGLAWNDPDIAIAWPDGSLPAAGPILSDKDKVQPALKDLPDYF